MKHCRSWTDVATDQQTGGLADSLVIDRVTASRLGIAPTTIDNTLYDAFGQRQINTMYTQLNQYHVILEAQPAIPARPGEAAEDVHSSERISGRAGPGRVIFCRVRVVFGGIERDRPSAAVTPSSGMLTAPANAITAGVGHRTPARRANTTTELDATATRCR